jgi:hypothetical protein
MTKWKFGSPFERRLRYRNGQAWRRPRRLFFEAWFG